MHTFAGNVRGMIAEQDFDASSAIVKVPKEMVLESNSIPETNPIPSFVTSSYWKSQRWWVRLALRLVYQKQTDKKPNLSGYVNALPKTFSTPFHWTAEELQETQYIPIQKQVKEQFKLHFSVNQGPESQCKTGREPAAGMEAAASTADRESKRQAKR